MVSVLTASGNPPKVARLEDLVGAANAEWLQTHRKCIRASWLARRMGVSVPAARRLLDKAVRHGLAARHERYSAPNCIAWFLTSEDEQ